MLRELNARKAKFGFAKDYVSINDFIPLGKLMTGLYNTWANTDYAVELVGNNQKDFRLYTDREDLAQWVRLNFTNL